MSIQRMCRIEESRTLGEGLHSLTLSCGDMAREMRPGQFVHVACGADQLLRRPISLCTVSGDTFRLVFQIKGAGTRYLAERKAGEQVDVLGPLGRGFDLDRLGPRPVFVGGGIGVPPLLWGMQRVRQRGGEPRAVLGFRSRGAVILTEEFEREGACTITTDDGSFGRPGFVTDALAECLAGASAVAACGPRVMLRAVAHLAKAAGVPCQVSLEERMGCGIGACLVCACALKGEAGQTRYGHVCKDGPVFDAEEVVW